MYKIRAEEIINNGLYDTAVNLMDDTIREELHNELSPCSDLEFLAAYLERHEQQFGEEFSV